MKKILFIYGYGGSPESKFCTLIREALNPKEYEVLCPVYPQEDCQKAHEVLLKFIDDNHIDLIIGTSLGGFIALTLPTTVSTIVLNPCMVPSYELPLLKPREGHPEDKEPSAELVASYKPFEVIAFDKKAHKGRRVMGLFAEQDELLGTKYKEPFINCYDIAWTIPGGHHGNAIAIPKIQKAIKSCFATGKTVDNWFELLCDMRKIVDRGESLSTDFCVKYKSTNWFWLWKAMRCCNDGEIVIRIIEGGNSIMKVGDSKCGYTPGLIVGAPIVLEQPNGSRYQGGVIESIDWDNETFKTVQSTYSFHFVRK